MGTRIRSHQSKSFQPNGLLPNETTSVIRPIDPVLWEKAEERTADLISQIQPNWSSEQHRNAVASYVQRLITNCVPCQVFTFGSVPLKTYLPDGDIDLTVFSEDQNLKDSWAKEVRDMLEREEKNELAEFQVKEVQFIQAEVKIIKCLVDNIVVDISFNQLGGLCTLCFLEEVDNKINQNHLFKRSIILIKAWCYYESRILGAHHGLISTYALETLVLYTFLVFNNSFAGPLEVLYRFLEFFSKFDWANFCVSLWGPVPIASLPSMAADPPRKDAGELLLNKMFLTACSRAYSVFPGLQETQEQPFISKHFNVVDPLRVNNNLGRSVSKGNFYRIRSAFSFGAQHLARILDSREDDPVAAVNQFFVNTLDRHGKGCRPDAPIVDSSHLVVQVEPKGGGNLRKHSRSKQPLDNSVPHAPESIQSYSSLDSPRQPALVRTDDVPEDVHTHKQKNRNDLTNQVASGWDDQYRQRHDLTERQQDDGGGENCRAKIVQNRGRTKHQFARTYSSPELTNLARNMASQYTVVQKVEKEASSVSNYPRNPRGSSVSENHAVKQATDRTSIRESSKTREPSFNSNSVAGSTPQISSSGDDDSSPTHLQGQDVMNLMPPMGIPNYGGHVHMPVNLPSHQLVQIPPSMLGYGHPMFADWGTVMHRSSDGGPPFPLHHFNPVGVGRVDRGPDVMGRSNGGGAFTEFAHLQDEEDNGFWMTDSVADSVKEVDPASEDFSAASLRKSPTSPANSSRTKASSESSWDGKHSKMTNTTTMMKYHHSGKKTRGSSRRATASDNNSNNNWQDDAAECIDQSYSDVDDDHKDWAPLSASSQIEAQQLPGLGPVHMSYPTSMLPFSPVLVRPGAHQGVAHNHGGLVAFYPAGPPVPFLIHYVPSETSTSSAPSREHETGPSAKDPEQLNNYTDNYDTAERMAPGEHPDEGSSSDIFNSDFASHWKNLQYGRFCQVSQLQHHLVYPPSIVVPPQQQLQGELPFNGPNQQSPRSTNVFAQAVPVSAHRGSNKPAGVTRRYGGEVSKNRNGTGTYFPNPKVLRDRQFPNPRQYRGDYNYDRNEYHEREVNGNFSKSRFNGRGQARYYEKPNSKMDQKAAGAFQTDRQWDTFQHNSTHSYRSSNEQYIGTNWHAHGGYWRRGDHQPQNFHADSEPPSPDYASPPRFPGGDNA